MIMFDGSGSSQLKTNINSFYGATDLIFPDKRILPIVFYVNLK